MPTITLRLVVNGRERCSSCINTDDNAETVNGRIESSLDKMYGRRRTNAPLVFNVSNLRANAIVLSLRTDDSKDVHIPLLWEMLVDAVTPRPSEKQPS